MAEDGAGEQALARRGSIWLRMAAAMAAVAVLLMALFAVALVRVDHQADTLRKELDRQRTDHYRPAPGVDASDTP